MASTLRVAGVGPVSMIVGSEPVVAVATIRARGVRPSSRPACSEPISSSAAPSTMPEELPAVCTWSIASTQWYFCSATASKPPTSPIPAKADGSAASPSRRGVRAQVLVPVQHRHPVAVGDRDDRAGEVPAGPRLGRPLLRAQRVGVDVVAAEALEGGDQVGADALRHERRRVVRSPGPSPRRRRRSPSAPATSTRPRRPAPGGPSPSAPSAAATFTASSPEAQNRLSCTPATVSGSPATSAAVRAMSAPWSPIGADDAEHDVVQPGRVEPRVAPPAPQDQVGDQRHRLDPVAARRTACPARAGCARRRRPRPRSQLCSLTASGRRAPS